MNGIGIHVFRRVNALHFESVTFRTCIGGKSDNLGTDGWLLTRSVLKNKDVRMDMST